MNDMFQEYKRRVDMRCVSVSFRNKKIEAQLLQEDDSVEIELPEEIQRGYIELEPMTPEEQKIYDDHKIKRNQIIIEKFKKGERNGDMDKDSR